MVAIIGCGEPTHGVSPKAGSGGHVLDWKEDSPIGRGTGSHLSPRGPRSSRGPAPVGPARIFFLHGLHHYLWRSMGLYRCKRRQQRKYWLPVISRKVSEIP